MWHLDFNSNIISTIYYSNFLKKYEPVSRVPWEPNLEHPLFKQICWHTSTWAFCSRFCLQTSFFSRTRFWHLFCLRPTATIALVCHLANTPPAKACTMDTLCTLPALAKMAECSFYKFKNTPVTEAWTMDRCVSSFYIRYTNVKNPEYEWYLRLTYENWQRLVASIASARTSRASLAHSVLINLYIRKFSSLDTPYISWEHSLCAHVVEYRILNDLLRWKWCGVLAEFGKWVEQLEHTPLNETSIWSEVVLIQLEHYEFIYEFVYIYICEHIYIYIYIYIYMNSYICSKYKCSSYKFQIHFFQCARCSRTACTLFFVPYENPSGSSKADAHRFCQTLPQQTRFWEPLAEPVWYTMPLILHKLWLIRCHMHLRQSKAYLPWVLGGHKVPTVV